MSRPRFGWWPYVRSMIRRYPQLRERWRDLKQPRVTVDYDATGHGSSVTRPTEAAAVRELPQAEQREYEAVHRAIMLTRRMMDGEERLRLVNLCYWQRPTLDLQTAAERLGIGEYHTARRYHQDFIYTVARLYGLLDGREEEVPKKILVRLSKSAWQTLNDPF